MKAIVFYDDLCGVCNYWVNWILKNDKNGYFYFAALQSDFEHSFSKHFNYRFPPETIVVWSESSGFLTKSDVLIYIFNIIEPTAIQVKALKLFPKFLRDVGYTVFAFFRKYVPMKSCRLLTKKERKRFLSSSSVDEFLNI